MPKSRKSKERASPTKTTECSRETNKTSHPLAIKNQKKEKAAVTVVKAEAPRQGRKKKMRYMSKESRNNNRFLRTKRPRKVKFLIWMRKKIGGRKAKRRVTTVVVRSAGVDLGVSRGPVARDVVHPKEARNNANLVH